MRADEAVQRLRELAEVQRLVTSSLDLSEVLKRIAQSTARLVGAPAAVVWTAEPEARLIRLRAVTFGPGVPDGAMIPPTLAYGTGIGGRVAESRRPIFVADVTRDPRLLHGDWVARAGVKPLLAVPIEAGEQLLGVLTVAGLEGTLATEEDQSFVVTLAALAGVALQNARVYAQAVRRAERLHDLVAVSQSITASLDLDQVLRMIAGSAAQLTETRFVAFWLADDATRTLSLRGGSVPEIAADFPTRERSYDVGVAGWVARHRTVVAIPDVFADARVLPLEWWRRWGLRSYCAHPVLAGDELMAVLAMSHSEPIEFSGETREVLDLFIAQAAVAIQNARLYRAAERRRDAAEALARLGRDLTGTLDHARIARLVAQGLVELLGSRNSAVYRLEPDGSLRVLAWWGPDGELLEGVVLAPGEGVAGRAVGERRLLASRDVLLDGAVHLSGDLRARLVRFGRRAIVGVPLIARDQVIGAMTLADDAREYGAEELQVLQTFAGQAALALDNARLYASARESLDRLRETQAQLVQAGKLSALGQLVSGVAHELNNPLSVIIGYGHLLAGRDVPDTVRRPLQMIVGQADRMAKIVHNLLYFSRQRPPEQTRLDLHQIIEQILALRLHPLGVSGIVVERDFASDLPMITADAHQLQQVFLNLLLNAEQAIAGAARGGGRIVLRTSVAEGGQAVRAEVIDDGPGIPPQTLPHVFEPFFTTKEVGAGTGLGLSVSYGIAQEHRGRLTVESRPGRTAFTLELPLGPPPRPAGAAATVDPPPPAGQGRRALLVEDEVSVRDFIVVLLEEHGWRVDTAGGGREALARLREHAYALIVSDIRMPDGSGEDLYRGAVAHEPALAGRFLFITGDTANPAGWAFVEGTPAPILEKPFAMDAFLDAVRRIVGLEAH